MKGIVQERIEEAPNTVTLRVALPEPVSFHAGQFFMLGMTIQKEGEEKFVKRAYSAASSPTEPLIDFTIRQTENGLLSPVLVNDVQIGDTVNVEGPFGKFCLYDTDTPTQITLIGAGSGIAPLRGILQRVLEREPIPLTILYSEKTPEDIIYKNEWEKWKGKNTVHMTITRPEGTQWEGPTGRLDESTLTPLIPHTDGLFFLCGPPPMVKDMVDVLQKLGVSRDKIRKEQYL